MKRVKKTAWHVALDIIEQLRAQGHVALLAGGCVRDMLLKRTPKDYDVATDARPTRVREIFPHALQVGAKFGVILVRKDHHEVEVATFRSDGRYSDGRHPDQVTFGTAEEDARRRDFTMNGLFFDPKEDRVIDYVDGRTDLTAGIIRTIGDPAERFIEDHLRMARAVRFAARLGFTIEPRTLEAIQRLGRHLLSISPERVWQELEQVVTAPTRAAGWTWLIRTGLHDHLVGGWTCTKRAADDIRRRLEHLPNQAVEAPLALAAIWCDESPEEVARLCRALRLSNRQAAAVVWLVRSLPDVRLGPALQLADLKMLMADDSWPQLLELLRVDELARGSSAQVFDRLKQRASEIRKDQISPPPWVTGDDLHALGLEPGPRFGRILQAAYRAQLSEEIVTRDEALRYVREWIDAESIG